MISRIIEKISSFADHHQVFFTVIIGFCVICMSWAVERTFDEYIFPHKPLYGYLTVMISAGLLLWFTQHFILHVM